MTNLLRLPESLQVIERGWLSSNSILLFDSDEATLIDSGYAGHAAQTVELVKSALAGRRLQRLVNTHSHSDHIGGNAALQKVFNVKMQHWRQGCAVLLVPTGKTSQLRNAGQEDLGHQQRPTETSKARAARPQRW